MCVVTKGTREDYHTPHLAGPFYISHVNFLSLLTPLKLLSFCLLFYTPQKSLLSLLHNSNWVTQKRSQKLPMVPSVNITASLTIHTSFPPTSSFLEMNLFTWELVCISASTVIGLHRTFPSWLSVSHIPLLHLWDVFQNKWPFKNAWDID